MAAHRRNAALAITLVSIPAMAAAGCGGQAQDAKEQKGSFPVKVISATFPSNQSLAKDSTMQIQVENAGSKPIPLISVTVKCPNSGLGGSFATTATEEGNADSSRPQFVVDKIPTAGDRVNPPLDPAPLERSSAFVDTYPLGKLAPGRKATFRWDVSAVRAGHYKLCWRVNAGLYGKAVATASGGRPISGTFEGTISNVAPKATVGPDGKTVIETPGG